MQNITNASQRLVDEVVRDYLYQIFSLKKHNHFSPELDVLSHTKSRKVTGFRLIDTESNNRFVVDEERFLEGCTRVFLINPIIKGMLAIHNIESDWQFGMTFGNYTITNREYELCSYLEFIAEIDGKKIGCRYTPTHFSTEEWTAMEQTNAYLHEKKKIPGFDNLSPIDELWSIDWSDASEYSFDEENCLELPKGSKGICKRISVSTFLTKIFSVGECKLVLQASSNALKKARDIIALSATPQLLPNNILLFKNAILDELSKETITSWEYLFKDNCPDKVLSETDIEIFKENFFDLNMRMALVGNSDFSKSFITSEYLFKNIKSGLSIDYTAVVVGYMKAVEQLLYTLYLSAFDGASRMEYWDRCWKEKNFDISKDKYRFDPYNPRWKQEFYYHDKKTGDYSPEIGELTRFLRYFEKMWKISEDGKEYVFACLDDFRSSCRNSYSHKENIDFQQYANVKRIRNNSILCLYFLLGGFKYLDQSSSVEKQLGIVDFTFENFYSEIHTKRRKAFWVILSDGYEGIAYYLNYDKNISYDASGLLPNAELSFVKLYDLTRDTLTLENIKTRISDASYLFENGFFITKESFPEKISPLVLRKP